MGIFP